jgi:hypothetical protein
MRTFRPAAPGSTSRTQPARNPCRAHNDVRGDRPVRQPRRRPGQHETGQHIGLQRRQLLRRHRRPRHPQISHGCQAQTRASSPSLSQQNERSRRYTFRKSRVHFRWQNSHRSSKKAQVLGLQRHGRAQGTLGLFLAAARRGYPAAHRQSAAAPGLLLRVGRGGVTAVGRPGLGWFSRAGCRGRRGWWRRAGVS